MNSPSPFQEFRHGLRPCGDLMTATLYLQVADIFLQDISLCEQLLYKILRIVDGIDDAIPVAILPLILRSAFKKEFQPGIIFTFADLALHDPVCPIIIFRIGLVAGSPPEASREKPGA